MVVSAAAGPRAESGPGGNRDRASDSGGEPAGVTVAQADGHDWLRAAAGPQRRGCH